MPRDELLKNPAVGKIRNVFLALLILGIPTQIQASEGDQQASTHTFIECNDLEKRIVMGVVRDYKGKNGDVPVRTTCRHEVESGNSYFSVTPE